MKTTLGLVNFGFILKSISRPGRWIQIIRQKIKVITGHLLSSLFLLALSSWLNTSLSWALTLSWERCDFIIILHHHFLNLGDLIPQKWMLNREGNSGTTWQLQEILCLAVGFITGSTSNLLHNGWTIWKWMSWRNQTWDSKKKWTRDKLFSSSYQIIMLDQRKERWKWMCYEISSSSCSLNLWSFGCFTENIFS